MGLDRAANPTLDRRRRLRQAEFEVAFTIRKNGKAIIGRRNQSTRNGFARNAVDHDAAKCVGAVGRGLRARERAAWGQTKEQGI